MNNDGSGCIIAIIFMVIISRGIDQICKAIGKTHAQVQPTHCTCRTKK
jgi:hypothetical protein